MRNVTEEAELLLDLAEKCDVSFKKNGMTLSAEVAMLSPSLVVQLVKLGLFSLNVSSMARMGQGDDHDPGIARLPYIPSALLGLGFHYAMTAAPRDIDDAKIVHVDALDEHIKFIERTFGDIDVDLELIDQIKHIANLRHKGVYSPQITVVT